MSAAPLTLLPLLTLLPCLFTFLPNDSTVDLSKIERLGDNLYAHQEYDAAALEYKRLIYYAKAQDTSGFPKSYEETFWGTKLALALYRNGEQNKADSILYSLEGPGVRMVRAVLLMEENNGFLAARQVDSATYAAFGASAYRLRGWAYLEAHDFQRSAEEFRKAGEDSLATLIQGLRIRLKNPVAARWLSLIPGLGETYAGRPLFGLWVFLVNAGDTYLVISSILAERYVDAVLAYSFLWQRFYTGSMANADRFARDWNTRTYKKALDPIRSDFDKHEALSLDLAALEKLFPPR